MSPAGPRTQSVPGQMPSYPTNLDPGFTVRLTRNLVRRRCSAVLDDPTLHRARQFQLRIVPSDRGIGLSNLPPGEQGLIGPTLPGLHGEQQHACGDPVQPVQRREVRQIQQPTQSNDRRLDDVRTVRQAGQEMRLVDGDQMLVSVEHLDLERYPRFRCRITIKIDEGIRPERGAFVHRHAVVIDDFGFGDLLHQPNSLDVEPGQQIVQRARPRAAFRQPDPTRVETVPNRERWSATPGAFLPTSHADQNLILIADNVPTSA